MAITMTTTGPVRRDDLHTVAERMRRAVVAATEARDLPTKVACWNDYRRARAEALGLLAAVSEGDGV